MKLRICFYLAVLMLGAATLAAQIPRIAAEQIECLPRADNGVIYATVMPEAGGAANRLYFRWDEDEDFYYVLMAGVGNGRYWGVPAKPDDKNDAVEYYVATVDPNEQVLAKSESLMAPVRDDCEVELTEQQRGVAENMTVGETTFDQVGEEIEGFLCDGVVSRINPLGILRGDERCRACVIAWWEKPVVMIPAAAAVAGTGIIITQGEPREASPVTPTPAPGGGGR